MFVLTDSDVRANEIQSCVAAGCSIIACSTILLATLWVRSVPSARNLLDRVSFRLLIHALCFEVVYDISYIVVTAPGINGHMANGVCATGVYFMMATMGVVNYHITFIAVNLAGTIVFGLNPLHLNLETWFTFISIFVGFFVPIVPAALGHFGWDPLLDVCWIKADNDTARIRNLVLDLYLWQLLSCLIATIAVIMTLVVLFRQGRATSHAMSSGNTLNFTLSGPEDTFTITSDPENGGPSSSPPIGGPIGRFILRRRQSKQRRHAFGHLEDRFVQIARRIAVYPVCLIIVNGVIAIGDLYIASTGGVKTRAEYGLYIVYYFFYGARGCFFALICVFVDPCLRNGAREAWRAKAEERAAAKSPPPEAGEKDHPQFVTLNEPSPPTESKSTIVKPDRRASSGNMDFLTALFELDDDVPDDKEPGDESGAKSPARWNIWRKMKTPPPSPAPEPPNFVMTFADDFAGVPADALPEVFDDDNAQDVVQPDVLEQARAVDAMERLFVPTPSPSSLTPKGTATPRTGRGTPPGPILGSVVDRLKVVDHLRRFERGSPAGSKVATPLPSRVGSPPPRRSSAARRPSVAAGSTSGRSGGGRRLSGLDPVRSPPRGGPHTERRERRDRAQELAERLYGELEAQL